MHITYIIAKHKLHFVLYRLIRQGKNVITDKIHVGDYDTCLQMKISAICPISGKLV